MRTLYLRNVPDEVYVNLDVLAKRAGVSMNAMAIQELSRSTRRAVNGLVLDSLPELDVSLDAIVEAIDEGRAERLL
jgi:plasmid stability protein